MGSDSDDDFERFLQEDDSASVSSASPVKKKVVQKATSKSKSKSDSKSKTKTSASTSSSRRGASGSSLSVVAAAERLLAASGKGKSKSKSVVEEEEEDEGAEEPPPSYSDDPYAFELGAKPSYLRASDEEKEEDDEEDDEEEDLYSSYKGGKSKKTSSKSDTKAKKVKKEKEREPPPAKREVKSVKTLEERVAEILKRTGSTTTITPVAAAEQKEEEDEGSEEEEAKPTRAPAEKPQNTIGNPVQAVDASGEDSSDEDDGSDLHRLSFSDSLGMESADFEVGLHARRKLDQSRLSLSSLNSEKFKVNMDALDESELQSHNRYDRQNDDFGQPLGTSDGAEGSDYGDDGFELDQTTDAVPAYTTITQESPDDGPDTTDDAPSAFVSEFEKMKSLFSLESPPKVSTAIETPDAPLPPKPISQPLQSQPPVESDTFGYDDEDFETDEVKASFDAADRDTIEPDPVDPVAADGNYGDDDFEGGEPADPPHSGGVDTQAFEDTAQLQLPNKQQGEIRTTVSALPDSIGPSSASAATLVDDSTAKSAPPAPIQIPFQSTLPSPPRSPPPPPPPDEDDTTSRAPPVSTIPLSQSRTVAQQRQAPLVDHSLDRFRAIENQVSSLRFMQPSSRTEPSVAVFREPQSQPEPSAALSQVPAEVIEDAVMAEEMKEIERLMDQARRVRKDRRKSVASVRSSAKESELALRLQQAQRQILQFKQHVQELADGSEDAYDEREEAKSSHGSVTSKHSGVESPAVTPTKVVDMQESTSKRKENERLKKEVDTQERLIQGFQRENEQLMKQLKQVQRDLHYDVHKENETLRVQLKELRTRLDRTPYSNQDRSAPGVDAEEKTQYRAAIEARLHAEALAESLQDDLNAQAKRHQAALNEMKIELEKVKKAKIDLECQYEGLDLRKMENETRQIKALKDQIQMQKTEHDHALAGLQKKIDWYVGNQRLLDEQDDKISTLKEENKQLKVQLQNRDGGHGGSGGAASGKSPTAPGRGGGSRSTADIRRIQELESRLSEMEEAMRKRHPDSLVSLIVASRKAEDESTIAELKATHQEQLEELRDEMEMQQSDHEKKLNAFRQQQEKLMLQYQKQIASLERQLNNKENQRGGGAVHNASVSAPGRNVKKPTMMAPADETELYRVRRFYAEKIKEVERKWEAKYRSLKKQQYASTGSAGGGDLTTEPDESTALDTTQVIRSLQQQVRAQDEVLRKLRSAGGGGSSQVTGGWEASSLRRRVDSLENQLKTSEDARRHLVETLTSLHGVTPAVAPPVDSKETRTKMEEEVAAKLKAAEEKHEKALAEYRHHITTLEQQVAEQSSTIQMLRNQFAGHIKEVERLQLLLTEAERVKQMLQDAAERVPLLESEVTLLRQQLAVPQTPSMLQFRSLELRIETLSQKHQLREAELKMMLMQATQSSQLEKLHFERMYEKALAIKNAEILRFKQQLEEILDELELLRRLQTTASPS